MKRVLFVYNPVSGKGIVRKKMFDIVDFYNRNGCIATMCPVREVENAVNGGMKLSDYDRIVVSGGDGTLNNFLTYCNSIGYEGTVAYVPSGSTNDYASTLGIPKRFEDALAKTITDSEKDIDIGDFNGNPFLYVAGFGIFTSVVYTTPQKRKNRIGYLAYLLEGVKALFHIRSWELKLMLEDKEYEGRFLIGLISNSDSIGGMKNKGGMTVSLDDGLFEVMFIRKPKGLGQLIKILWAYLRSRPDRCDNIITGQYAHIDVEFKEPVKWTLDGEYGGEVQNARISVNKKKFKISL